MQIQALEAGQVHAGVDAGGIFPQPLAHAAIGIVVEAVHTAGAHTGILHIAVPAFPDGGGAVIHGVQPAGVLPLEKEFICNVLHMGFREGGQKDRSAQETGLQAVVVLLEVLPQAFSGHISGFFSEQVQFQAEEGGGLHGVQDVQLERSVYS